MSGAGYRASRYNFFFPLDDCRVLAYNALANAILVIGRSLSARIGELERSSAVFELDGPLSSLAASGFIVPAEIDEVEAIRRRNRQLRDAPEALTLTIAPTLSCNFGCAYCFQSHPRHYMSVDVQNALVEFVERHCPALQNLGVSWFGGEPILAIKVVHRLSRKFADLAERSGVRCTPAAMITNGWGLTEENCALLRECNIDRIQVTIDGVGAVHDQRRMLVDGRGTFDRIVSNVRRAVDLLPGTTFSIRVNLERANAGALQEVADYMANAGLQDRVHVYPGHVEPYTTHSRTTGVLTDQEFYEIRRRHDEVRLAKGQSPAQMPTVKADTYCCAQLRHAFVVIPSGAMFKCWNETGTDETRAVGHLLRDTSELVMGAATEFDTWDITQDPECAECKVLPLCGGGCVWRGMMAAQDFSSLRKIHSPYLYGDNLERAVRLQYQQFLRQQQQAPTEVSLPV
jgi:uncharacterized protein